MGLVRIVKQETQANFRYMQTAILKRLVPGTFGKLTVGTKFWFTAERPWVDNQNNVSCIPTGTYTCRWTLSPRLKRYTYEILNVPKRSGIRIHSGNFPNQVLGCACLGLTIGVMDGQKGVFNSVTAVRQFETLMNKKDFTLAIL